NTVITSIDCRMLRSTKASTGADSADLVAGSWAVGEALLMMPKAPPTVNRRGQCITALSPQDFHPCALRPTPLPRSSYGEIRARPITAATAAALILHI